MKIFLSFLFLIFTLSSCLKQTIAEAMQNSESNNVGDSDASISYRVNGTEVKTTLNQVQNNTTGYRRLYCQKDPAGYTLSFVSLTGELIFSFYTNTLQNKNYVYRGSNGTKFFLDYNNTNSYTRYPTDSMSFNITTIDNGHINGNFSGKLTPSIVGGAPDTYGASGSILITNGTFKNIPVFE